MPSHSTIESTLYNLIDSLSPFVKEMGFDLKKKRSFVKKTKECDQELNIQFRYIKGQEAGYIALFPNITFENIGKMIAFIKSENYKKGWPTVAANIGNLQENKEYLEYPLVLTSDFQGIINLLMNQIVNIAKPFWDEYSTLDNLINGYEKCDTRLTVGGNSYIWNLVAAYCLKHDYEKAIVTLKNWDVGKPSADLIDASLSKINELWRKQ